MKVMRKLLLLVTVLAISQGQIIRIPGPGGNSPGGGGGPLTLLPLINSQLASMSNGQLSTMTNGLSSFAHEITAVTSSSSGQIPSSQSNFSVFICANLTLANSNVCATETTLKTVSNGGDVTNSSGYDIVPSSTACASPTALPFELIDYSPTSGLVVMWAKLSTVNVSTTFYLCFGNSSITTFQGGPSSAVWDSNYVGVWHMGKGSSYTSVTDSTGNANNSSSVTSVTATNSQPYGGGIFVLASGISIPDSSSLALTTAVTMEAWMNASSTISTAYCGYVGKGGLGSSPYGAYEWYQDNSTQDTFGFVGSGVTQYGSDYAFSGSPWTGVLHHYALTEAQGGTVYGYIDGVTSGSQGFSTSAPGTNLIATGLPFTIGTAPDSCNSTISEVRVSNVQRSANWLLTQVNNQTAPTTFMTMTLTY
jgi:hypothetical protein